MKTITVIDSICKIGDKILICVDGSGNIMDYPQPAIITKQSTYEEYIESGGKLNLTHSGPRYYYEFTTD